MATVGSDSLFDFRYVTGFCCGGEHILFLCFGRMVVGTYDLKRRLARVIKIHLGAHTNFISYEFSVNQDNRIDILGWCVVVFFVWFICFDSFGSLD